MQQTDILQTLVGKRIRKGAILVGGVFFSAATLSVPYFYPTETLWYKAGFDKVLLQAGQFAGLLTLILLVVQILLALRPSFLGRAFGAGNLIRWHQRNGLLVALTALAHVLLVLAPEGLSNLPLGWRYWPEILGAVGLIILLITVLLSHFRTRLKLNFKRWRMAHRPLGYALVLLLGLHVLFVSESFAARIPRIAMITVIILLFISAVLQWIRRGRTNLAVKQTS